MKPNRFRSAVPVGLTMLIAGVAGLLLIFSPILILFLSIAWNPDATLVMSRHHVIDRTGVSLEALHVSYDFVGGWEEVAVYARRPGEVRKTMLFAYDPAPNAALPEMTFPDKKIIRIAVPRIEETFVRRDNWNGYNVQYEIGTVAHPR